MKVAMETEFPEQAIDGIITKKIEKIMQTIKLQPIYLNFSDTAKRSGLNAKRLRAVVNYEPFYKELDSSTGGPVYYPRQGQGYMFDYVKFSNFCHKHTDEIWNLKIK